MVTRPCSFSLFQFKTPMIYRLPARCIDRRRLRQCHVLRQNRCDRHRLCLQIGKATSRAAPNEPLAIWRYQYFFDAPVWKSGSLLGNKCTFLSRFRNQYRISPPLSRCNRIQPFGICTFPPFRAKRGMNVRIIYENNIINEYLTSRRRWFSF